jgi:hypothetical protein
MRLPSKEEIGLVALERPKTGIRRARSRHSWRQSRSDRESWARASDPMPPRLAIITNSGR